MIQVYLVELLKEMSMSRQEVAGINITARIINGQSEIVQE